jgi:hypothetical protein
MNSLAIRVSRGRMGADEASAVGDGDEPAGINDNCIVTAQPNMAPPALPAVLIE